MKKIIIIAVILILLVFVGIVIFKMKQKNSQTKDQSGLNNSSDNLDSSDSEKSGFLSGLFAKPPKSFNNSGADNSAAGASEGDKPSNRPKRYPPGKDKIAPKYLATVKDANKQMKNVGIKIL